ncbi:MAG: hypothetical protein V1728_04780, partial [Candidatus Micrarchaeota archaeon]
EGTVGYCIHKSPEGVAEDPKALLYFLHPAEADELSWREFPISRVYYKMFHENELPAPRVVTISYGPYWTLMDEPGEIQPALFETFVSSWMPLIERETGPPNRRYLWGMSQGAFNSSLLVLKRPKLFDGAVLSCPSFFPFPLYSDAKVIAKYVKSSNADAYSVDWAVRTLRPRVGGPEAWKKEDPLKLAARSKGLPLPPILIQANKKDEYGFYKGAKQFYKTLKKLRHPVSFRPYRGMHCVVDAEKAVDFLIDLTANH